MHGPAAVGWLLAALCALTGLACLRHADRSDGGSAGRAQRWAARSEATMGFGMAAMALPVLAPGTAVTVAFAVFFAAAAGGELVLLLERRHVPRHVTHHLHHLVGALAMVHMTLVMPAADGSGGHHHRPAPGESGVPLLSGLLLTYFAVCVLHAGFRLMPTGTAADDRDGAEPSGLEPARRLAMGTGMFAMLLPW